MQSNQICLDTSVIIDFLRQKDKSNSLLYKLASKPKLNLSISILTHTELYAGKIIWENKIAKKELKVLLSGLNTIKLNETISQKAGKIKAQTNLDLIDSIIAATAIKHKIALATLNTKHFNKIKSLKLFKL